MKNKRMLFSNIGDCLTVILVIVSLILLFVVGFPSTEHPMAVTDITVLKFYTVDSNVMMGVTALICLIYKLVKKQKLPFGLLIMKFIFVTAMMVTCLTTLLYLLPYMQDAMLVTYANLFLHILSPITCLVQLIVFEDKNEKLTFKHTLFNISSLTIYGLFYLINIAVHDGYGNPDYDWYGFGRFGLGIGFLVFALMIGICWGISLLIFLAYRKINIRFKEE